MTGVKTFTAAPDMDGGINVGGNITPNGSITIGNANTTYLGDGSQLVQPPDSGTLTDTCRWFDVWCRYWHSNNTYHRCWFYQRWQYCCPNTGDTILGTAQSAANLTVNGNVTIPSGEGIFTGDGSGLTNIAAVAGPFTFMGEVDAVNGSPPTNPTPDDAFITSTPLPVL